ncbi:MAG: hypothetical protein GQ574_27245 [Crocinitomix sp.]|nr:hypothetical protein [Crocinitomix sp.]
MENKWTKQELKAYVLLFAAHANFLEDKKEMDFIKKLVGKNNLDHMHDEFDADNDYQRIQKIKAETERLGYGKDEIDNLFLDIKALFIADGRVDVLEENLFRGLKHILT